MRYQARSIAAGLLVIHLLFAFKAVPKMLPLFGVAQAIASATIAMPFLALRPALFWLISAEDLKIMFWESILYKP